MDKTIAVLNTIKKRGLIDEYAIGGGIATIFYTEPLLTYDLDVFVMIEQDAASKLISFAPIYHYLEGKGYAWRGEHIVIEGMPVQFLPADGDLEREAVAQARKITYKGVPTKVIGAEWLIALLVKAGRQKDREKVTRLLEQTSVDRKTLKRILTRSKLYEKFHTWETRH